MQKNYRSFSNGALIQEYADIQQAVSNRVRDKGRAPKWLLIEEALCGAEILRRMKDSEVSNDA